MFVTLHPFIHMSSWCVVGRKCTFTFSSCPCFVHNRVGFCADCQCDITLYHSPCVKPHLLEEWQYNLWNGRYQALLLRIRFQGKGTLDWTLPISVYCVRPVCCRSTRSQYNCLWIRHWKYIIFYIVADKSQDLLMWLTRSYEDIIWNSLA
jgi:hypothetical protein